LEIGPSLFWAKSPWESIMMQSCQFRSGILLPHAMVLLFSRRKHSLWTAAWKSRGSTKARPNTTRSSSPQRKSTQSRGLSLGQEDARLVFAVGSAAETGNLERRASPLSTYGQAARFCITERMHNKRDTGRVTFTLRCACAGYFHSRALHQGVSATYVKDPIPHAVRFARSICCASGSICKRFLPALRASGAPSALPRAGLRDPVRAR